MRRLRLRPFDNGQALRLYLEEGHIPFHRGGNHPHLLEMLSVDSDTELLHSFNLAGFCDQIPIGTYDDSIGNGLPSIIDHRATLLQHLSNWIERLPCFFPVETEFSLELPNLLLRRSRRNN